MLQRGIYCTFLFCLTFCTLWSQTSELRIFKDTLGREMRAKLTRVSGKDVYIERDDGYATKVLIDAFSDEDQEYIRNWAKKALLASGIFELEYKTDDSKRKSWVDGGIYGENYYVTYEIILENTSNKTIEDIEVEYLVHKFSDRIGGKKRSEGQIERIKGKQKIGKLIAHSSSKISTQSIKMVETELMAGYYYGNGGKDTSKDKLRGIWVKIYVDGDLVQEDSQPESMKRTEQW